MIVFVIIEWTCTIWKMSNWYSFWLTPYCELLYCLIAKDIFYDVTKVIVALLVEVDNTPVSVGSQDRKRITRLNVRTS